MKVLARLGVPGYQPYERLGPWLRQELRPFVERVLLSPTCLERGIFRPETIRAIVDNHVHNRRNHTYLILSLLLWILTVVPLGIATWPSTATWQSPITLGEIAEWVNSGNIVTTVALLAYLIVRSRAD